jgi:hypothetical protein
MSRIIKTGMQIVCDRKNHSRPEAEKKAEAVIDPKYIKFYTAIDENIERATAEGKKSKPMFKCEIIMPDENGTPKSEVITYEMIAPDQIAMLYGVMQQRLAPPSQRGRPGGPKKEKDASADTADNADTSAAPGEPEDEAEEEEQEDVDGEEGETASDPAPAAVEPPKKSASEKARDIAKESTKKAKAATPPPAQLSESETSHLFDE